MDYSNFSTQKSPEFERLLQDFKPLAEVKDLAQFRFQLIQVARSHRLPIAETKGIYRAWISQQQGEKQ